MRKSKKGAVGVNTLLPIGILFVVVAIAFGLGSTVLDQIRTDQLTDTGGCNATSTVACGYDYNASTQGLSSIDTLASWLPTIALVIVAAIVIGVVVMFMAGRKR